MNIVDIVSAKRILVGEANPIYILTKSYWVLLAFKVIFIGLMLLVYKQIKRKKTKDRTRFTFCMLLVYALIGLSLGTYSNISAPQEQIEEMEVYVQELKDQGDYEKLEQIDAKQIRNYANFSSLFILYPLIFGFISFLLYESSTNYFKKEDDIKRM